MEKSKLSGRVWFNLILFGLIGQIAWNVENMYFNTFLYNSVYHGAAQTAIDSSLNVFTAINLMVALSAATAVITTFLMGTLSDRMNRRKVFISAGYLAWGLTTAVFGLVSRDSVAAVFGLKDAGAILTGTVWIVILLDCLMTFMGSTSNDSAFNAWVTDVTNTKNRGVAESVLALMPILAMGIVIGLGALVESIGYSMFFLLLGGLVSLCGIVGLVAMKDSLSGEQREKTNYLKDLVYGFRPSVIKKHAKLYLSLAGFCLFSIGVQVFFPYILIYMEHALGFRFETAFASLTPLRLGIAAAVLAGGVGLIILLGKLTDRFGKHVFILPSTLLFVAGLVFCYSAKTLRDFGFAFLPAMLGYCLLGIVINASIRDYTPQDKAGQFQGIRMIFAVLLPMIIGPTIGNAAARYSALTYINEYGVETTIPSSTMFLAAAIAAAFVVIPMAALMKLRKAEAKPAEAM